MSITLGSKIVELYPGALRGYFQEASGTFAARSGWTLRRVFAYGETLDTSPPAGSTIQELEDYWYECALDPGTSPTSWRQNGTILTGYVLSPGPPPAGTFWVKPYWEDDNNPGTFDIGEAESQDYNASAA